MRSSIVALPLSVCFVSAAASRLQYRDEFLHLKRQTTVPANTPCSNTCAPFLTAATPCNGASTCLCTTAIFQDLQTCVTCLGDVGGSAVSTDIESAASQFNQKCAGAVPSVTIPISAAANTAIPDSSGAGGFSADNGGFGASSDGSDFNTVSDDSFNTDGGDASSTFAAGGFGTPATGGITVAGGAATPVTNANPFAPAAATGKAGTGSSGSGSGAAGGSSGSGSGNSGSGGAPGSAQADGASKGKSAGYHTVRTPSMQHFENGVAVVVTMALLLNL